MDGEISLSHLACLTPVPPHITSLRCYPQSPYQLLKTWGVWPTLAHPPSASYFRIFEKDNPFKPFSQNYNFELVKRCCLMLILHLLSLAPLSWAHLHLTRQDDSQQKMLFML